MIAICIESSNSRGMGHLFRSLLYAEFLKKRNEQFIYLINNDEPSLKILSEKGIDYIIVDFSDIASRVFLRISAFSSTEHFREKTS